MNTTENRNIGLVDLPVLDTTVLSFEDENRWVAEFSDARIGFAELISGLPDELREIVLEEDVDGPAAGVHWPLSELGACFARLVEYGDHSDDPALAEKIGRARQLERRMTRARERLIMSNLGLVHHLARKHRGRGIPYADLVQEGTLGLIEAVEKFECGHGCKLSSYSHWWIRKNILRAFSKYLRLIRVPEQAHDAIRRLKFAEEELSRESGREPSRSELAERTRMPEETVSRLLAVVADPQSFDTLDHGADAFVVPSSTADPEGSAIQDQMDGIVSGALDSLSPRERRIIRQRFGFGRGQAETLAEIGRSHGLSRERVRQIEIEALNKMRRQMQPALRRTPRPNPAKEELRGRKRKAAPRVTGPACWPGSGRNPIDYAVGAA